VITRALGTDPDVDVDTFSVEALPGDVFLICSDGLSSYVDGGEIEQIVSRYRGDLETGARSLIDAANRGGGEDNITAVLFAVGADGEPDERTREYAVVPDVSRSPEDEDTLHPEDNVTLPPEALDGHAPIDDTMVVSAAALAEARESAAAVAAAPTEPEAGLGRRVLASLVIVALVALIVLLAWWGLAR